jgi:hypothetical protein
VSDTDTPDETTAVDTTVDDSPADDPDVGQTFTTDAEEPEEPQEGDADTFPRSYVERLRRESAGYRERAQNADAYARRLHLELVRATGKLADPTDLEFAEEHLDDPDALAAAIDNILTRKPHLASRRPTGDIGQGAAPPTTGTVDLAALLRQRAQ